jgi:hypothetical protein
VQGNTVTIYGPGCGPIEAQKLYVSVNGMDSADYNGSPWCPFATVAYAQKRLSGLSPPLGANSSWTISLGAGVFQEPNNTIDWLTYVEFEGTDKEDTYLNGTLQLSSSSSWSDSGAYGTASRITFLGLQRYRFDLVNANSAKIHFEDCIFAGYQASWDNYTVSLFDVKSTTFVPPPSPLSTKTVPPNSITTVGCTFNEANLNIPLPPLPITVPPIPVPIQLYPTIQLEGVAFYAYQANIPNGWVSVNPSSVSPCYVYFSDGSAGSGGLIANSDTVYPVNIYLDNFFFGFSFKLLGVTIPTYVLQGNKLVVHYTVDSWGGDLSTVNLAIGAQFVPINYAPSLGYNPSSQANSSWNFNNNSYPISVQQGLDYVMSSMCFGNSTYGNCSTNSSAAAPYHKSGAFWMRSLDRQIALTYDQNITAQGLTVVDVGLAEIGTPTYCAPFSNHTFDEFGRFTGCSNMSVSYPNGTLEGSEYIGLDTSIANVTRILNKGLWYISNGAVNISDSYVVLDGEINRIQVASTAPNTFTIKLLLQAGAAISLSVSAGETIVTNEGCWSVDSLVHNITTSVGNSMTKTITGNNIEYAVDPNKVTSDQCTCTSQVNTPSIQNPTAPCSTPVQFSVPPQIVPCPPTPTDPRSSSSGSSSSGGGGTATTGPIIIPPATGFVFPAGSSGSTGAGSTSGGGGFAAAVSAGTFGGATIGGTGGGSGGSSGGGGTGGITTGPLYPSFGGASSGSSTGGGTGGFAAIGIGAGGFAAAAATGGGGTASTGPMYGSTSTTGGYQPPIWQFPLSNLTENGTVFANCTEAGVTVDQATGEYFGCNISTGLWEPFVLGVCPPQQVTCSGNKTLVFEGVPNQIVINQTLYGNNTVFDQVGLAPVTDILWCPACGIVVDPYGRALAGGANFTIEPVTHLVLRNATGGVLIAAHSDVTLADGNYLYWTYVDLSTNGTLVTLTPEINVPALQAALSATGNWTGNQVFTGNTTFQGGSMIVNEQLTVTSLTVTSSASLPSIATAGTYTCPSSMTIRADGFVTSVTSGSCGGSGTVTSITAGTGLSGGTITSSGTIAIASTGVTAASYSCPSVVQVNAQGQVVSITSGTCVLPLYYIGLSFNAVTGVLPGSGSPTAATLTAGYGGSSSNGFSGSGTSTITVTNAGTYEVSFSVEVIMNSATNLATPDTASIALTRSTTLPTAVARYCSIPPTGGSTVTVGCVASFSGIMSFAAGETIQLKFSNLLASATSTSYQVYGSVSLRYIQNP